MESSIDFGQSLMAEKATPPVQSPRYTSAKEQISFPTMRKDLERMSCHLA